MSRRLIFGTCAVAACAVSGILFSLPIDAATTGAQVQLGGTLTVAKPADVDSWDPTQILGNDGLRGIIQTNGNLIMDTPNGKGLKPYIAQSWKITKGGRVYTFHLFPTAKFCDGSQITSSDVVWSFTRAEKAPISSWMFPKGIKVTAPSSSTVVITIPQPDASFIQYVTLYGMEVLSKAYGEKVGNKGLSSAPLGSGPFCLKSWQRGSEIDLVRNPFFWLKDPQGNRLPYVDEVHWKIIKDDTARAVALQSGQVDAITDVSPSQVASLKKTSGVTVGVSPLLGTVSVLLSQKYAPLTDVHVRQALNYAVDKNALIKAVLFGYGRPALSPLYLANYTNEKYGYHFSLPKAKALMAASKYPNGFKATVIYKAGDTTAQQTLVILKDQWAKIGVNLNIQAVEPATYSSVWSSGKWQMNLHESTSDIFDPAEVLTFQYGGKAAGQYSAWTYYENPSLYKLILKAQREQNTTKRAALYNRIQRIMMSNGPLAFLYHPDNIWAERTNVHGFAMLKTAFYPFMYAWKS